MPESSRKSLRADAAALVVLALATGFLFLPGLQGRLLTMRDMTGITLPSRAFWREAVLSHQLPFWNPLVGTGVPALAVPIHGALYPGHVLLLVGSLATGVALTWGVHMWIAAAGGFALARVAGCRPESALVAALVFGMGGYAVSMSWNGEKTLPLAWIPWTAWAIHRAVRSPSRARLVVAAVPPALLCAAGDPFLLLDALLLSIPFALAAVPASVSRRLAARDVIVALTLPMLLAGLLAAPVLLPAILLRGDTDRATPLSQTFAESWSLHPVRWLELFVSRPLGDPLVPPERYTGSVYADDPYAQAFPWAVSLYVGAGAVGMATAARGRLARALAGAAVLALLLALGRHLPFHGWARATIPLFTFARYPEKHVVVVCDALAILAAMGASRLLHRESDGRVSAVVAVVGLLAAALLAPAAVRGPVHAGAMQSAVVLCLLLAAFVLARRAPRFAWVPALVIGGDLLFAARPLLAWSDPPGLPRSPLAEAALEERTDVPPRVFRPKPDEIRDPALLPYNAANLYGIDVIPGLDSARTPELPVLMGALAADGPRTWEILRVSRLIAPVPGVPEAAPQLDHWKVVTGPSRPRAWMVGRIRVADGDVAIAGLASADFDVEGEALVSNATLSPDQAPLLSGAKQELGACAVERYALNRVDLACSAPAPALVVLADAFSDGWHASVDGVPAPIARADALYRGVALGSGSHRVRFTYDPPGLTEGVLVAALGLLVAALAIARGPRGFRDRETVSRGGASDTA